MSHSRADDVWYIMRSDPNSNLCADCRTPNPRWTSSNLGIFICWRCANIHKKLGGNISNVKSISMDYWTEAEIANMSRWGNTRANEFYCPSKSDRDLPPNAFENDEVMETYIRNKYERRIFQSGSNSNEESKNHRQDLNKLKEMGFQDESLNLQTLRNSEWNLEQTIENLIRQKPNEDTNSIQVAISSIKVNEPNMPKSILVKTKIQSPKRMRRVHFVDGVSPGDTENEQLHETRVASPTLNSAEQIMALQSNSAIQFDQLNPSVMNQLYLPPEVVQSNFFTANSNSGPIMDQPLFPNPEQSYPQPFLNFDPVSLSSSQSVHTHHPLAYNQQYNDPFAVPTTSHQDDSLYNSFSNLSLGSTNNSLYTNQLSFQPNQQPVIPSQNFQNIGLPSQSLIMNDQTQEVLFPNINSNNTNFSKEINYQQSMNYPHGNLDSYSHNTSNLNLQHDPIASAGVNSQYEQQMYSSAPIYNSTINMSQPSALQSQPTGADFLRRIATGGNKNDRS